MKRIIFSLALIGCLSGFAQTKKKIVSHTANTVAKSTVAVDTVKEQLVEITTPFGVMIAKLYNSTPLHRDNFISKAKEGFYDSLLFHRVIKDFMIQGGDPKSKGAPDSVQLGSNSAPGPMIPAEFNTGLIHKRGALAAARDGNPTKQSSNCQFYIVQGKVFTDTVLTQMESNYNVAKYNQHITDYLLKPENLSLKNEVIKYQTERNGHKIDSLVKAITPVIDKLYANDPNFMYTKEQRKAYTTIGGTPHLDCNYTVFGEVYEGLDIIDKIAAVKTGANDRPVKDVKMTIKVIE